MPHYFLLSVAFHDQTLTIVQNFEPERGAQVLELLLGVRDAVLMNLFLVSDDVVAGNQVSRQILERVLGNLAVNQASLLRVPVNAVEAALTLYGVLQRDSLIALYLIEQLGILLFRAHVVVERYFFVLLSILMHVHEDKGPDIPRVILHF